MSEDTDYSIAISNYIRKSDPIQALPEDFIEIGDKRTLLKKRLSIEVANSFKRLKKFDKSDRIKNCGTWQYFAMCTMHPGERHLIRASFCRERLCPMCQYRRGLKIKKSLFEIIAYMKKDNNYKHSRYLFLTLTVKNCPGEKLAETIDMMYDGLSVMCKKESIFKSHMKNGKKQQPLVLGMVKTLEITYSKKNKTFHPHIHILMNVKASYLKGANYISQKEFAKMWASYCELDYEPIVDIRAVKDKKTGEKNGVEAIKETGKYAVKDTDIVMIRKNGAVNETLTDIVIRTYDKALKGRKMIIFTGSFLKVKQFLFKDDDLDNIDTDDIVESEEALTKHYCETCGAEMVEKIASYNFGYNTYQDITSPETIERARREVVNSKIRAKEKADAKKNRDKRDAAEFKENIKQVEIFGTYKDIASVDKESRHDKLSKKLLAMGVIDKVDCKACRDRIACTYYINRIPVDTCANFKKK